MQETQNPYQDLLLKAAQDEAFREALLSKPRETLAQFLGTELPAELKVSIVENTPSELTLVIPPLLGDDLDDDALDGISGGSMEDRRRAKDTTWSLVSFGFGCLMSLGMEGHVRCVGLSGTR